MQKRNRFKPKLTIAKIGKVRFWTGITLGVLQAVILFLFFFLFIDSIYTTSIYMGFDFPSFPKDIAIINKIFLISLCISLGIHTTIRFWFSKPTHHYKKTYRHTTLQIRHHSFFIQNFVMYTSGVFMQFILVKFYFRNPLFYENFKWLLFCIPLYIFFSSWNIILKHFRALRWQRNAFILSIVAIMTLSFINFEDKKSYPVILNSFYAEEFHYIQKEVKNAREKYEITFTQKSIDALKGISSFDSKHQYYNVVNSFGSKHKTTLDTIILGKIIVHNFKMFHAKNNYLFYNLSKHYKWSHLHAGVVYGQLFLHHPDSPEAYELISILELFYHQSKYSFGYDKNPEQSKLVAKKIDFYSNLRPELRNIYAMPRIEEIVAQLIKADVHTHPFLEDIKNNKFDDIITLELERPIFKLPVLPFEYSPEKNN